MYGFGSGMCHIHGMPHACHVEVKWLMDWLYIWTCSLVRGSEARRKGKGKKEKEGRRRKEKEKKEERKGGREPEPTLCRE